MDVRRLNRYQADAHAERRLHAPWRQPALITERHLVPDSTSRGSPNLVRVFIWCFSTGEVARLPVMRGIDLGRGLVKRLARQRRFEPPLS
jgi:hypothetical protein